MELHNSVTGRLEIPKTYVRLIHVRSQYGSTVAVFSFILLLCVTCMVKICVDLNYN